MTFDSETDRKFILDLIEAVQIPGKAVLMVADLVRRIQRAEIVQLPPAAESAVLPPTA